MGVSKIGTSGRHRIHHSSSALRRCANCCLKLEFSAMMFFWPIVSANTFAITESPQANELNCWIDGWNFIFMTLSLSVSFTNVSKLFLNFSATSSVFPDSIESIIEHEISRFPLGWMHASNQWMFSKLIGNIVNLFASKIPSQIFLWLLANVFLCIIFDAIYVSCINGHLPVYSLIQSNTPFKILSFSQSLPFKIRKSACTNFLTFFFDIVFNSPISFVIVAYKYDYGGVEIKMV